MIQDIDVKKISDLPQLSSDNIDEASLLIISVPNDDGSSYSSYKVTYADLSASIYHHIDDATDPDADEDDPKIININDKIESLTEAVLRLANCAKQVRTSDLKNIYDRLVRLEEFHKEQNEV